MLIGQLSGITDTERAKMTQGNGFLAAPPDIAQQKFPGTILADKTTQTADFQIRIFFFCGFGIRILGGTPSQRSVISISSLAIESSNTGN